MEQWEIDFNWLKVQHYVKDKFKRDELPKLETILFIIGIQELGKIVSDLNKEEKLGITTLGICKVLSQEGYFKQEGVDETGWPIWKEIKPFDPVSDLEGQNLLKAQIGRYFEDNYDLGEYEQEV